MARTQSYKIDIADLEYCFEYLIVLAFSPMRVYASIKDSSARRVTASNHKIKLYKIGIEIEKLFSEHHEYSTTVEKCEQLKIDLEGIIMVTLDKEELAKMRTSIRQKRFKETPRRLFSEYAYAKQKLDESLLQ